MSSHVFFLISLINTARIGTPMKRKRTSEDLCGILDAKQSQ